MCLAVPGRVVSISTESDLPTGKVAFGSISKDVCLAYVPEARPGDYVLVHVGVALSTIDEAEARRVFAWLEEIDGLREEGGAP